MNIKGFGMLIMFITLISCDKDDVYVTINNEEHVIELKDKGEVMDAVIASDSCSLWILSKENDMNANKKILIKNKTFIIK